MDITFLILFVILAGFSMYLHLSQKHVKSESALIFLWLELGLALLCQAVVQFIGVLVASEWDTPRNLMTYASILQFFSYLLLVGAWFSCCFTLKPLGKRAEIARLQSDRKTGHGSAAEQKQDEFVQFAEGLNH